MPFDSEKKYMITVNIDNGTTIVNVKGAPETVLSLCNQYCYKDTCLPIDDNLNTSILEAAENLASKAYRVLGFAYLEIDETDGDMINKIASGEKRLIFLGIAGMIDPPRNEVIKSISIAKGAGIKVIMATGDHKKTAEAIAREVGILEDGYKVVTGAELETWSDEKLDQENNQISVFSRVSPTHKYRVVMALKNQGKTVAMTGDGVNDAPALKTADIGIAMGINGSDVTKETADMILADDNFSTIINAIEEGRLVFENITKVVKFLITTNIGEILALLGALILIPNAPIIVTPVQILWVNLITDGLLTLPLAVEPMEEAFMQQPPRKRDKPIIDSDIRESIIYVSIIMAVGILYLYNTKLNQTNIIQAQNIAFLSLAMYQVFNAHNCRSKNESIIKRGLFTNRYLILSSIVSIFLLVYSTYNPLLRRFLGTEPLSVIDWGRVLSFSSLAFILQELRKSIKNRKSTIQ